MGARGIVRRFGYDVTRYPHPTTLSGHLSRLLRRLDINCVIDVGANVGQFASSLRSLGYSGRIVSFEPSIDSVADLQRAAASDQNWRVVQLALGAASGAAVMHRFAGSDLNSLHSATHVLGQRFDSATDTGTEVVTVATLSEQYPDCVRDLSEARVLLKIDTQGHDLEVIKGGESSLDTIMCILIELSVATLYEGQPGMSTTIDRLAELGFVPSGIFPISRTADGLAVIEFDGVFVHLPSPSRQ